MKFLQSLHGEFSGYQKIDFCRKFVNRTTFFITSWNNAPNSWCNKKSPHRTVWIFLNFNLVPFLKSCVFSIIEKTFFIVSGAETSLTLNIAIATFWMLRWPILKELFLSSNSSKKLVYTTRCILVLVPPHVCD